MNMRISDHQLLSGFLTAVVLTGFASMTNFGTQTHGQISPYSGDANTEICRYEYTVCTTPTNCRPMITPVTCNSGACENNICLKSDGSVYDPANIPTGPKNCSLQGIRLHCADRRCVTNAKCVPIPPVTMNSGESNGTTANTGEGTSETNNTNNSGPSNTDNNGDLDNSGTNAGGVVDDAGGAIDDATDDAADAVDDATSGTDTNNSGTGSEDDRVPEVTNADNSGQGSVTDTRNDRVEPARGCFDPSGNWTTDRMQCAANQSIFLNTTRPGTTGPTGTTGTTGTTQTTGTTTTAPSGPAFNPAQEAEVRQELEARFVPEPERARRLDDLLDSVSDALTRLQRVTAGKLLPIEVLTDVSGTTDWLMQTQITFGNGEHTLDEIQRQAEDVRIRLNRTQTLIGNALKASGTKIERIPETLIAKLDHMISTIPTALTIMLQDQVSVSLATYDAYLQVQVLFGQVKAACLTDPEGCNRFGAVISGLEPIVAEMKSAIDASGNTMLQGKIDLLFQQ